MVSTRHHPREFPPPDASPTKASPRKSLRSSTASASPAPTHESPSSALSSSPNASGAGVKRAVAVAVDSTSDAVRTATSAPPGGWSHTASNVTVAWLAVSIPLVIWDSLYVLLRPHTMEGGALQWPLWKPYEIYASIDHVYGWPGWNEKNGFGAGQAVLNVVEVVLYGLYFMIVYNHGELAEGGSGLQVGQGVSGWLAGGVKVRGRQGSQALLIGFTAAVMTASKTLLYYVTEYASDFHNTKHNDWPTFLLFYVVMNGLWVVFPMYMTLTFGSDLLAGLDAGAASSPKDE